MQTTYQFSILNTVPKIYFQKNFTEIINVKLFWLFWERLINKWTISLCDFPKEKEKRQKNFRNILFTHKQNEAALKSLTKELPSIAKRTEIRKNSPWKQS